MTNFDKLKTKFKIGTVVKVTKWHTPKTTDEAVVLEYVKAKYGESPLSYITAYASDAHVYLSHLSSKQGKGFKMKIPVDNLEIVDTTKLQDPPNYNIDYLNFKGPLSNGDEIIVDGIRYIIVSTSTYDYTTGTGKITGVKITTIHSTNQNNLIEHITLTATNWKRAEEFGYSRQSFNNAVYLKEEYKDIVKEIFRNQSLTDEGELNYIVNSQLNINTTYKDYMLVSDNYHGINFIVPISYTIDLHSLLIVTSSMPLPTERKFTKLKCLKNKGKTQYKLTVGKEYAVIKYQQDELIGSERVIILNDNNVQKSYDPKLFKGIE